MTTRSTRRGYTLLELVVVMAILLLLAAVVLPSIGAFRGDTRLRAAADVIRGELATARGHAMESGVPYRVAINQAGTRIRRAPDGPEFAQTEAFGHPDGNAKVVEYAFEHVTAEILAGPESAGDSEWRTIATLLPDGTALEENVVVGVREDDRQPMRIHVRGLTGTSRVVTNEGGAK